jgi:hypothetical protein
MLLEMKQIFKKKFAEAIKSTTFAAPITNIRETKVGKD